MNGFLRKCRMSGKIESGGIDSLQRRHMARVTPDWPEVYFTAAKGPQHLSVMLSGGHRQKGPGLASPYSASMCLPTAISQ